MPIIRIRFFPFTAAITVALSLAAWVPMRVAAYQSAEQTNSGIERQSTGTISGTVTDEAHKPVQGAQVSIKRSRLGMLTDSAGRYLIANVPAGQHKVEVVFIGYTRDSALIEIKAGEHVELFFALRESAVALTDTHGCFACPVQQKKTVTLIPKLQRDSAVKRLLTAKYPVFARQNTGTRPQQWCAPPRTSERLLMEGIRFGSSMDEEAKARRASIRIATVPRDSITIVRDETVCQRAAAAYATVLRTSVPDRFGSHTATPVLVVAVGSVYLVDDLRSRDAYWEVMVFDRTWRRRYGYGDGA